MLNKLIAFFRSKRGILYGHLLFWLVYSVFWLVIAQDKKDTLGWIYSTIILLTFHAVASYFNLYVLIPLQLQRKKYGYYVVSLLLTITLLCFPLMMSLYRINGEEAYRPAFWNAEFFLVTAISISYTVVITMAISLFFRWFNKEQQAKRLQVLNAETELKYLKSQIDPHFLFNSLNSLYSLSLKKSEETPTYIIKLSELLRYLLYEGRQDKVPLSHEIGYLENYLEIEKLRIGNRATIEFEVLGNIDQTEIEPMLFLPFVENAVKHGLGSRSQHCWMKVTLELTDDEIFFTVRNNVQASNEVLLNKKEGGIGLENVKKRLNIFYPDNHELTITNIQDIFEVVLKISIQ